MPLSGQTIGVTGATGFLGSHLARVLSNRGAQVVGIVRTPARGEWLTESHDITFRKADLRDRASLHAGFDGLDAIVNNATLTMTTLAKSGGDWEAFMDAERQGTSNVIEAALQAGVPRLVHISTVAVYRLRGLYGQVREDHPRRDPGGSFDLGHLVTRPEYAAGKALSEELVWSAMERGLRPTVLRPGPVYGSRDPKLTQRYLKAMERRIRVVPTIRLPHVHAGDVAIAAAGALHNDASEGQAYNVTGAPVSLIEVARTLRRLRGGGPWLLPLPVPLRMGWDNSAAERDLGVRFRSLSDGLQEVLGQPWAG